MRTLSLSVAAAIAVTLPVRADDALLLAPPSTQVSASLKAGAQAMAKIGDIVYWEDERTTAVAFIGAELDEGSSFLGDRRALPQGARLRKASFGGQELYCAVENYQLARVKNAVLCLVDADGDKAFETSKLLGISRESKPGDTRISNDATDTLEQPLPYRAEDAYPSVGGLRAVIRYRGLKDGQVMFGCAIEPKGESPAGLTSLLYRGQTAPREAEHNFAAPAATPVDVAVPLCVENEMSSILKQLRMRDQFVDPYTQGERPAAFQVAKADAQSVTFRLVRPFARWFVSYEKGPDDLGSLSFQQLEK